MVGDAKRHHSALPGLARWSDLAVACVIIVLCLPLMVVVAAAIECENPGPLLSWEARIGPDGQRFWGCRFRICACGQGPRAINSQMLTFTGNLIRWLHVDALPQLINVLRGEMTSFPGDRRRPFFLD